MVVVLLVSGCCGGSSRSTAPVTQRFETLGISIETRGHTGGPVQNGYMFTSGDSSSITFVHAAAPGLPASQRSPGELLPGATIEVQWQRPVMIGGMPGFESRVIERAPMQQVHWIGALDGPRGPVWIHLVTDQRWITGPTVGDLGWQTLRDSVRRL